MGSELLIRIVHFLLQIILNHMPVFSLHCSHSSVPLVHSVPFDVFPTIAHLWGFIASAIGLSFSTLLNALSPDSASLEHLNEVTWYGTCFPIRCPGPQQPPSQEVFAVLCLQTSVHLSAQPCHSSPPNVDATHWKHQVQKWQSRHASAG